MLWTLVLQWNLMVTLMEIQSRCLLLALGYEYRPPVYGSILFTEGEWVKRR